MFILCYAGIEWMVFVSLYVMISERTFMKNVMLLMLLCPMLSVAMEDEQLSNNRPRINVGEYARQEALIKIKRAEEDRIRQETRKDDDQAAVEVRNQEGFWSRFTHAVTSDAATDQEKQQTRNKAILKKNRERIFEDFARKAQQFETFKETHSEFSKTPPWDSLLELGDMNKFINMSPEERTAFTTKIADTINQLLSDDTVFKSTDFDALTDLIQLTRLHDLGEANLPTDFQQKFQTTFTSEFSSKTPEEQQEIAQALKNLLKESLKDSVKKLTDFNTAMEEIKGDINSLQRLRAIKEFSNAAFWILGTAAGVLMLSHATIIIKGIELTMEKFAIGAKIGLFGGHKGAHLETELSKHIQTKFQNIFSPLLPKTTALIDTVFYENKAKSIKQRISETRLGNRISRGYNSLKEGINNMAHKITNRPESQALQRGLNKLKSDITNLHTRATTTIKSTQGYRTMSSAATSAKEKLNSTATSLNEKIKNSAKFKNHFGQEQQIDTSEFDLRMPKQQTT